jgi:hypothetical protein
MAEGIITKDEGVGDGQPRQWRSDGEIGSSLSNSGNVSYLLRSRLPRQYSASRRGVSQLRALARATAMARLSPGGFLPLSSSPLCHLVRGVGKIRWQGRDSLYTPRESPRRPRKSESVVEFVAKLVGRELEWQWSSPAASWRRMVRRKGPTRRSKRVARANDGVDPNDREPRARVEESPTSGSPRAEAWTKIPCQ